MIIVSHGTKVEIFMKTNDLEFSKNLLKKEFGVAILSDINNKF